LNFDNKGFIFIEIIISLILIFILLTIFAFTNSTLVRLLEEVELNRLFYLNSLNIGNELVIYLLEPTNAVFSLGKNYTINEIEENYHEFNSSIDERIRAGTAVNLTRRFSVYGYILYEMSITSGENELVYLFYR